MAATESDRAPDYARDADAKLSIVHTAGRDAEVGVVTSGSADPRTARVAAWLTRLMRAGRGDGTHMRTILLDARWAAPQAEAGTNAVLAVLPGITAEAFGLVPGMPRGRDRRL